MLLSYIRYGLYLQASYEMVTASAIVEKSKGRVCIFTTIRLIFYRRKVDKSGRRRRPKLKLNAYQPITRLGAIAGPRLYLI